MTMRTCLLAVTTLLFSLPAGAVDGIDLPGFDYAGFPAASAAVCRNSCGGDTRCQAWTWVKPGVQGPDANCYLKDRLPELVKDSCCNSGPREYISASDLKAEDNTNRPGSDYSDFVTNSWKACETACGNEQQCGSWTYVQAGVQGPQGHCWLKTGVPNPAEDQNCISGVKFQRAAVRLADPALNPVGD